MNEWFNVNHGLIISLLAFYLSVSCSKKYKLLICLWKLPYLGSLAHLAFLLYVQIVPVMMICDLSIHLLQCFCNTSLIGRLLGSNYPNCNVCLCVHHFSWLSSWVTVQKCECCHLFQFNVLYNELYFMIIIVGNIDFVFCYLSRSQTHCFALLTFSASFRHRLFRRCAKSMLVWKGCARLDLYMGLYHHENHWMCHVVELLSGSANREQC